MFKMKTVIIYYVILTIAFLSGRTYIMNAYKMSDGPVPQEAFQRLFSWVSFSSYFFIVPLMIIGSLAVIRFFRRKGLSLFLSSLLGILYLLFAATIGYVLMFIFILLFYGFAP
ncbi:hypothetical protein [Brevibacillus reuszeri]|uniref:hypothetical protein n=1 Tax=Brevibacillus reuszeri TaxID=54915 RepID=UPI0028991AEC|nr:hypothetical protein [Brevibacillus reuszeri]